MYRSRKSFQGGSVLKNLPASAGHTGDPGLILQLGRSSGNDNPLQEFSCLENSRDRGAWQPTVHGVVNSQTRLSDWSHTHVDQETVQWVQKKKKKRLVYSELTPSWIIVLWWRGLRNSMKHWAICAIQGHARWTGHGVELWQNMVHWKKEWQSTPVFLLQEPHKDYEKVKKKKKEEEEEEHERWKDKLPGGMCPICYWGRVEK